MQLRLPRHFRRELDLWSGFAWLIGIVIIIPLVTVLSGLFEGGPKWDHLQSTVLGSYVGNTFVLTGSVTVIALLIAVPAAWVVSIYEFPGRRLFSWLLVLPLSIVATLR